jgi:hypothetical protein
MGLLLIDAAHAASKTRQENQMLQTNIRNFYPTLTAAAKVAEANMISDPDWSYVCESHDDGATWSVAIYDEDSIKVGYIG